MSLMKYDVFSKIVETESIFIKTEIDIEKTKVHQI